MVGTLLAAGRHEPQDGLALLGLPELVREEGRNGQLVDQGRLLGEMGQVPLFPPTVAGWEDGLAWLNTNTALARFNFVGQLLDAMDIDDILGETAAAAYDRAFAAVGGPWLAPGTQSAIRDYANQARSKSPDDRKQRQLLLRALMLAGPDAQVM